jgi:hypothetical protein
MPATFALILLILAGISLIACYIPACGELWILSHASQGFSSDITA